MTGITSAIRDFFEQSGLDPYMVLTIIVIVWFVLGMIIDSMNVVPCKMAMPIWLDRLKSDKSRTVREACSLYLGVALFVWGGEAGYLTLEIWTQVGTALIKALMRRETLVAVMSTSSRMEGMDDECE